ncbi:MAG: response regulator [Prolixibacteraceae bacterium]|nr:response regulator [Prolixibacteraceae bacterium]
MTNSRVLIVDDEPLNLMLYTEILKSSGFTVIQAEDGLGAVRISEDEIPDLILLDWNMPNLDGFEALKILKSKESTKEIPVIMITGVMTSPDNLQRAMNEGASDFIRKPFDRIELNARIRSLLSLSMSMKEIKEKYQIIENKNKFIETLIGSVPQPLVYYTIDGIISGYNFHFLKLLDLEDQHIDGTLIYRYFNESERNQYFNSDMTIINNRKDIIYECKLGKEQKDYVVSKTSYSDSEGNLKGILVIMTEISELKKAHNDLMESKKRELTSSALRLIQISEMNNNLIGELEKVYEHTSPEGAVLLKSIISQFNISSGINVWKEFESRFENVFESFYDGLNSRNPELTPGEKKLCALLRLNLSSKDIAALTFQNSQSVDMARYRLRKKLNLSPEENLVDFLMKI